MDQPKNIQEVGEIILNGRKVDNIISLPVYVLGVVCQPIYRKYYRYLVVTDFTSAEKCSRTLYKGKYHGRQSRIPSGQYLYCYLAESRYNKIKNIIDEMCPNSVFSKEEGVETNLESFGYCATIGIEIDNWKAGPVVKCSNFEMGLKENFSYPNYGTYVPMRREIIEEFKKRLNVEVSKYKVPAINPELDDLYSITYKRKSDQVESEWTNGQKRQNINGANLVFGNYGSEEETQPTGNAHSHSHSLNSGYAINLGYGFPQESANNVGEDPSIIRLDPHFAGGGAMQIINSTVYEDHSEDNSEHTHSFINSGDLISTTVTIEQIESTNLLYEQQSAEKYYELNVSIKGIFPLQPFIIRPYKRTLKLANLTLLVSDLSNNTLKIEFNSTDEVCKFLDIEEPEEILNKWEKIGEQMGKLLEFEKKQLTTIKIKRSTRKLANGFIYPYWTSATILDKLVSI